MIFDLYAVVRNFGVNHAHTFIGFFFPIAPLFTLLASAVTVVGRIIIDWQWVWRVLFLLFLTLFLCIKFRFVWFTVIGFIRRIRFVRLRVRKWWVWLRVRWYVSFYFSLWRIHWSCQRLRWSCQRIRWSCQWRGVWHPPPPTGIESRSVYFGARRGAPK